MLKPSLKPCKHPPALPVLSSTQNNHKIKNAEKHTELACCFEFMGVKNGGVFNHYKNTPYCNDIAPNTQLYIK